MLQYTFKHFVFKPQYALILNKMTNERSNLTYDQNNLLKAFCQQPNKVITKSTLLSCIKLSDKNSNVVDRLISELRRLLLSEKDSYNATIKTVKGEGYLFLTDVERIESRRPKLKPLLLEKPVLCFFLAMGALALVCFFSSVI